MTFRELVTINRSYRRFDSRVLVSAEQLRDLVELACYVPSAKNLQPLRYLAVSTPSMVDAIFPTLSWAGYLPEWQGPIQEERPTAYLVMVADTTISRDVACDMGIAAQTILLGATAMELGGCMVASLERQRLRQLLSIDEMYEILMVIALGKPIEKVVIDQISNGDSVRYYCDAYAIHHVPKRMVESVLLRSL
uniref:Nitroreductase family protein n=1 Tax=Chlorobium chlorochromatii (strain CaD3) TaxID=340177 RepID=Q3AQQ4_CHLCH